jgi:hypothetical protein
VSTGVPSFVARLKNLFSRRHPAQRAQKQTKLEQISPTKKAPSEHFLKKLERLAFGSRGSRSYVRMRYQGGTFSPMAPIRLGMYGEKRITGLLNWKKTK